MPPRLRIADVNKRLDIISARLNLCLGVNCLLVLTVGYLIFSGN